MSEEEKKSFEELKKEINKPLEVPEDKCNTFILYNIDNAKVIVNLIEKQQKEIETYKLLNANIEKDNKRQSIAIIEYQDLLENSISKDKIREKIKDLENEREQLRIDKKVTWDSQIYKIDLKISAYRELLEEE